jgi:GNAT superfamily N-acetyltransferase
MDIKIIPVTNKTGKMRFIKSQWKFYRGDKNWVPPIVAERSKLLDTDKNPFYKHSKIQLFLAERDDEVVGRIAAIMNGNHQKIHKDSVGHFGFFECVDDQEVADALYAAAEDWLKNEGMKIIRGPVNPSQNDECAFLAEGFDSPPVTLMPYNPEYYLKLTEGAGFSKAMDTFAYHLLIKDFISPKMERLQQLIRERHEVTIRNIDFKHKDQFYKDVDTLKEIYNQAWEPNWGFVKMTNEEFDFMAADLKPVADPKFAFIAESKGKPVGFALGLPDVNECLIHNKGGSLLGALWHLLTKKKKIKRVRIIVLGVLPEYQKTGIDALLYYQFKIASVGTSITCGEASWVLEDNEMMNKGLQETMNSVLYKKCRFYEKEIK